MLLLLLALFKNTTWLVLVQCYFYSKCVSRIDSLEGNSAVMCLAMAAFFVFNTYTTLLTFLLLVLFFILYYRLLEV